MKKYDAQSKLQVVKSDLARDGGVKLLAHHKTRTAVESANCGDLRYLKRQPDGCVEAQIGCHQFHRRGGR